MSILSPIGDLASRYAEARARRRGERILLSLPTELCKDIGFPEIFDTRNGRRSAIFSARVI
ncbi:hypothetical protein [Mesorhizobium sp.]|uniref:hypothetical protein n=1 Tax=Mesorhizobium sp. TaxID=1871066 RepID=UPI0025CDACE3|nr:hypothetical protein [Mesorhizobium sp.]